MTTTKEELFNQFESFKRGTNMPDNLKCIGEINEIYPTIAEDALEEFYRIFILESNDGIRIATCDDGDSYLHFLCDGSLESITAFITGERVATR